MNIQDPSSSSSNNLKNDQQPQKSQPPQRRRLQPSDKQLKQSSNHPQQRQKTFSGSTIMAGLYDLEETLGKGHFATVKAAKHVFTGERVAVKVIEKTKLDTVSQKALLKEVLCMKLVQHPNVVKLYEVIDTSTKMYLVLELGQGDLYDLILRQQSESTGGLPEQTARVYFTQILTAVSYCHKLHVAHRDLKPENVVFFPPPKKTPQLPQEETSATSILGQVKLTDFGFSNKFCPGVNLDTSCGSLAYSAPEILLGDSYDAPAVDIWSLGVILYMLVCGRAPFQEANDSETLTMIMDVKYSIPEGLSRPLKDLIRKMLVRDPLKRARLEEIEVHSWVCSGGAVAMAPESCNVPLISCNRLSENERERIFNEMLKGGIVSSYEEVKSSLRINAYNHVTSTYYLLAERFLREKAKTQSQEALVCKTPTPPPSSPPMIIRRKNSHQFEDVVLPSTITAENKQTSPCRTTLKPSMAGLDLETLRSRKSQSQKFVCLPVIEPELEDEEVGMSKRNSSPHHPHYYHHLRGANSKTGDNESSSKAQSPPLHHRRTKLNKSHHHSHSDSSDEGGGGGVAGGGNVPPSISIVVDDNTTTSPQDDDDDDEVVVVEETDNNKQTNNNCLNVNLLKPSPSYDNSVAVDNVVVGKKKRVLFLSWFFKRSSNGKGKKDKEQKGANGIYKTRSCAELKSRGCGVDQELSVRECFAVCNGDQNDRKFNAPSSSKR